MEAVAIGLLVLLFGAAAIGKNIDIGIRISTPQHQIEQQVVDHVPRTEVLIRHGHES